MLAAAAFSLAGLAESVLADGNGVVFYRIGEGSPQQWTFVKEYFEGRGYPVIIYQGETQVEKHIEKVDMINRSPAKILLAVQMVKGDVTRVTVAMTDAKKEEGRFLTIDQTPGPFAEESQRLATDIAAPFKVKVKHFPLFPLLGVTMPGAFVRVDYREGDMEDVVHKLCEGVGRYFTERMAR